MLLFLPALLLGGQSPRLASPRLASPVVLSASSSRLDEAYAELSESARYEALVLQRCAGSNVDVDDLIGLVGEMTERGWTVSEQMLSSIVDAVAAEKDADKMAKALKTCRLKRNIYGRESIGRYPTDAGARQRILARAPDISTDDRGVEVGAASAAGLTAASALYESFGFGGADYVGLGEVGVVALVAAGIADNLKNDAKIGNLVGAGFERLTSRDVRRESECQAASFLLGYYLGLPCFAFAPTALEAIRLTKRTSQALVWSSAAVACESIKHRRLIASDPRQPQALLEMARDRGTDDGDASIPDEDRLRLALFDARRLLRTHEATHAQLADYFESGAATVGDCVALIERNG